MNIRTGELWLVQFDPQVGKEQAGVRPALVISCNQFNTSSPYVKVVVPLTSKDRGWPTHIRIAPSKDNGLTKPSWVLCEQIQCTAIERFSRHLGNADDEITTQVVTVINRWIFGNTSQ